MLYLVWIFILFNLYNLLPSDDIWNKMLKYMEEGKLIYPDDKNYFIFDESNYTALDINGTKMKALYKKQEDLYKNYRIPNYIFAVDKQDENIELIQNATTRLAANLKSKFNIDSDNAMLFLFSKNTNRTRLRFGGTILRIIGESNSKRINSNVDGYLKVGNYYGAWNRLIDDVSYYRKSKSSGSNSGSKGVDVAEIVAPIVGGVVLILIIICCCYCCKIIKKKQIEMDYNFRKVGKFLNDNRYNHAILTDYCSLCLEKLRNETFQETKAEAGIIVSPVGIKADNINSFSCGHQFHTNCITKFKIAECPICKQRGNPDYNQEDAKIIWGTQVGLFPILKGYNYNDIYKFDFNKIIANKASAVTVNNDRNYYDSYYRYNENQNYQNNYSNVSYPSYNGNDNDDGPNNSPSIHASGGAVGGW